MKHVSTLAALPLDARFSCMWLIVPTDGPPFVVQALTRNGALAYGTATAKRKGWGQPARILELEQLQLFA